MLQGPAPARTARSAPCNARPRGMQCRDTRAPPAALRRVAGAGRRGARQTDHRDHEHLLRLQPLPPHRAGAGGSGQAWGACGGRAAGGVPADLDPRGLHLPDVHVPPQPDGHGLRGARPRPGDACTIVIYGTSEPPACQQTRTWWHRCASAAAEAPGCVQPMDAVVLIGGCDKTVPAQLMAAAADLF